ncbi:plasma membrane ATPase 1-like [Silene latifolia]|uniref:plasma membrane ATPase 1-like n=1 Tax=Silene latifolia TaxID=37657 RepID=UPI003D785B0A
MGSYIADVLKADARLVKGDPLKIDQSTLTMESPPVTKGPNNSVYSGCTCKQGDIEAIASAIRVHTFFFGKTADLVDSTNQLSGILYMFYSYWDVGINHCHGAIIKRMTNIEEMVGMDVLCSDKTRTFNAEQAHSVSKGVDADTVVLMAA